LAFEKWVCVIFKLGAVGRFIQDAKREFRRTFHLGGWLNIPHLVAWLEMIITHLGDIPIARVG